LANILAVQKDNQGAVSKQKVDQEQQNLKEKEAALTQAEATVVQAESVLQQAEASLALAQAGVQQAEAAERQSEFAVKLAQSNVAAVQAELENAHFNLNQCLVRAPADGYVVDWQVQEGTMVVALPMSPAGTFIETADTFVVAVFPQNHLMNVQPGNDVDLALDPYPGRQLTGKVDNVIAATGEGQFTASGTIPHASSIDSQGMLAVKIRLTGASQSVQPPLGAGGSVAIYTDYGKPVHIISKVTIRMKKWLLYVVPSS